jgi:RNA polymerase sigma factor for flagellar operon FliA
MIPQMDQAQRDALAREHMQLLERIVASMTIRFGGVTEPDELRSFAMVGLASAIERYDESRGVPFGAYASRRIRGAVYDGLAQASWFPRRLMRQIAFYRRADEMMHYAAETPAARDTVETAHHLADRLQELATAYVTTYAAGGLGEQASSQPEAEELVERKQYADRLQDHLETLPEAQQTLIRLYFYEDLPLSEIATRLGYHKSWASRALGAALGKLRRKFAEGAY